MSRLRGISLSETLSQPLVISAYADDVHIFVRDQADVEALKDSLRVYVKASFAKVNSSKSEALQVGRWSERAVASLPSWLQCGNSGLKVLGDLLGNEGFQKQNWEGVMETVCAWLSKWKWLLPQL